MTWLGEHWTDIVAIVGGVVMTARIIVKLTPTPKDDAWLAKAVEFLKQVGLQLKD